MYFRTSLNVTYIISANRHMSPKKWTRPSILSVTAFPVIFLIARKRSLPPSRAGNGSRLITARLRLRRAASYTTFMKP